MDKETQPGIGIFTLAKSPAIALLLSVFLGPIGMLYGTVLGGLVMLFLVVGVFTTTQHVIANPGSLIMLWIFGCVWSVLAVNCYNRRILNQYMGKAATPWCQKLACCSKLKFWEKNNNKEA